MNKLLARLKEDALTKKNLKNKDIAVLIGKTAGQTSNLFNGTHKMKFSDIKLLAEYIYEDIVKINEVIGDFLLKTTKPDNLIEGAEWALNNGQMDVFDKIIENESIPIFKCYHLIKMRNHGGYAAQIFYNEIEKLKSLSNKTPEMSALLCILSLYLHADMNSFKMIRIMAEDGLQHIKEIKSPYIKNSFEIKIMALLAHDDKNNNNIEEARLKAQSIIDASYASNIGLQLTAGFNLMAELEIFTNMNRSISYIKKALETFYEKLDPQFFRKQEQILMATHDFINIYHRKYDNLFLNDPAECAHYLAMQNNEEDKNRALGIIEYLRKHNENLTAIQTYYKYLATNELSDGYESICSFSRNGDYHYLNTIKGKITS